MADETTLLLLKPDCISKNLAGEVIRRLQAQGFRLRGCKMIQLTDDVLKEHYARYTIDMVERDDVRSSGLRVPLAEVVLDALRTHDEQSRGRGSITSPPAPPQDVDIEFDIMKSVRPPALEKPTPPPPRQKPAPRRPSLPSRAEDAARVTANPDR